MKKIYEVFKQCPLFDGIEQNQLFAMLDCIDAKTKTFYKGQTIIDEGDKATHVFVVLDGVAEIFRIDFNGNKSIIAHALPSQLFAEAFACSKTKSFSIRVSATTQTTIMAIPVDKIISTCHKSCHFHSRLALNLLKIIADKNLALTQKIEVTSKRTTRDKLMTYLLLQAKEKNSNDFCIPFDRQGLADYLEVDRSGLSAEISKLRNEGVISCRKNNFCILKTDDI